jgi:hypothetical protein
MARTDIFLKVTVDHEADEKPDKLADEIVRRLQRLYGVRSAEVSSMVSQAVSYEE